LPGRNKRGGGIRSERIKDIQLVEKKKGTKERERKREREDSTKLVSRKRDETEKKKHFGRKNKQKEELRMGCEILFIKFPFCSEFIEIWDFVSQEVGYMFY